MLKISDFNMYGLLIIFSTFRVDKKEPRDKIRCFYLTSSSSSNPSNLPSLPLSFWLTGISGSQGANTSHQEALPSHARLLPPRSRRKEKKAEKNHTPELIDFYFGMAPHYTTFMVLSVSVEGKKVD